MSRVLHDNWKWIVGSIVFVVVAIVAIMLIGGGEDMNPFQYSSF